MNRFASLCLMALLPVLGRSDVSLNGSWAFRFEEGRPLEQAAKADFAATDTMTVPGCYDVMKSVGTVRRFFSQK